MAMQETKKTFLRKKFNSMLVGGTLTSVLVTVMMLSDTIIAGFTLGEDAVAAINLVTPMYSLAAFFGTIVSIGVPILYSNAMGRFEKEAADRYFGFGFTVSVAIGIIMFILLLFFGDAYLRFYNPSDTLFLLAKNYFFWYKFDILILPLSTLMVEMLFADGDETTCTIAGLVEVIGNIALSIILSNFIGISGIGASSFIGTLLSLSICFTHLLRPGNSLKINFYFSKTIIPPVIKYSIIDSSTYLFLAIFTAAMNHFVSAAFGSDHLILVSIILFMKELQLVFDGIGEALNPILSVYLGEKTYDGVHRCFNMAAKMAVIEGIIVTILFFGISSFIPGVYGIADQELSALAASGIRIISLSLVFISLLYLITSYYLLIDKIFLGVIISGMRDVIFALPLAVILGLLFNETGMFIGIMIAPFISCIVAAFYVYLKYGKENFPLILADREKAVKEKLFDIYIEPEAIIRLQSSISDYLEENEVNYRVIGRIKLLTEEIFMLIYEKNEARKDLCGECVINIEEDGVQMITKDDGKIFNISDEDVIPGSILSFAVSSYMEAMKEEKKNLTTMSCNRNTFFIKNEV